MQQVLLLCAGTDCDLKKSKYGPTKNLKSTYSEFQFEQQIKNYTRIAPTTNDHGATETTKSLIDHIATNRPDYIIEPGTLETSFTDHHCTNDSTPMADTFSLFFSSVLEVHALLKCTSSENHIVT